MTAGRIDSQIRRTSLGLPAASASSSRPSSNAKFSSGVARVNSSSSMPDIFAQGDRAGECLREPGRWPTRRTAPRPSGRKPKQGNEQCKHRPEPKSHHCPYPQSVMCRLSGPRSGLGYGLPAGPG